MTGSIHDQDDLSQEVKDDLVAAAVDRAIEGLRALADLTDVSLKSAAETAVWASCEGEASAPSAPPQPEFCNACGFTHPPDDCDLAFEVVDLTVDLTVTIRSAEDPVQYVRNAMSFRDERGNNVTVTDVFRNDE